MFNIAIGLREESLMRVAITGGTGFVGKALTKRLLKLGHEIFILTRHPSKKGEKVTYVQWLVDNSDPSSQLKDIDIMVNLAGESINSGRWTEKRKKRILDSRLEATEEVLSIIKNLETKPKALINASAIGFYGTSLTTTYTETDANPGRDFLATTCKLWEEKALQAENMGVRTVLCRFGIILDKKEGALAKMAIPYHLYVGGPLGKGEQWMSWIHLDDVVEAILFIIGNAEIKGPVNFTAPNPLEMKDFGKVLGSVLHRPHWLPAPAFALQLALGEMSSLVLEGQRVLPEKLLSAGYPFLYNNLEPALRNIYQS